MEILNAHTLKKHRIQADPASSHSCGRLGCLAYVDFEVRMPNQPAVAFSKQPSVDRTYTSLVVSPWQEFQKHAKKHRFQMEVLNGEDSLALTICLNKPSIDDHLTIFALTMIY